ncbi:K+-transporting ATPase, A subunit [Leptospira inadai serovar Lyme str. 10]|uniref:Potassium-transporting ATPase potassium-binding subunit n=2 Tax=Leptospira inadai serovar Lyme TaxID=293084 RepID=V6HMC3_9LEPT|nr:potassium-transporting ATPase subunit KdpA [Leptospira inadai]EQA38040.1 K+-transporting ATPase, A subunit [Leptospira inadai serovar Lyme str. 10]PNV73013.1 potassium-transporting ATPase subunit KdpA [Leptospira inadai serovar Lyme]
MNGNDSVFYFLYFAVLFLVSPWLGLFIAKVLDGEFPKFLKPVVAFENLIYKVTGVDPNKSASPKVYALEILGLSLLALGVVTLGLRFQEFLPWNPEGKAGLNWDLAWNTSVSFVTNTNWQAYSGEASLSYGSQMLLLGVQNFVSAAVGIAILAAMARGILGASPAGIGNFFVDLTRSTLYILLPLSILFAIAFVAQGVVMDFSAYVGSTSLEGVDSRIPLGPAASQIAIKQLGTNGGGFFGVNSAHPFENPTPFSNWLESLLILLIPASLPFAFGKWAKSWKAGVSLFIAMLLLFAGSMILSFWSEIFHSSQGFWPNWEGKEIRFGIAQSVLWEMATTAASNGSVNSMHDSFSPLSGGAAVWNILLGEIVFGGVGVGLAGMLFYVILTVFLAGLMVGRTPEYFGKKIESREVKYALFGALAPGVCILLFTALASSYEFGLSSRANQGPHGLTEILYAFASASGNNGSAFAGLNANTQFYNFALSFCMLLGRFAVIWPAIGLAGALMSKKKAPAGEGTFSTDGALFVLLLVSVIGLVGALTFLPVLVLGPGVEFLLQGTGRTF